MSTGEGSAETCKGCAVNAPHRLGLDLGTNSIGWALYRLGEDDELEALCDGGVLIHSDGRQDRGGGRGRGASKAAARREKRGMRRNRDRMHLRRQRVATLLRDNGLLPPKDSDEWKDQLRNDPLELRAEALVRPLTPHELGRVLFWFVDHRGFKSNRKTDGGEDGKVRQDTNILCQRIEEAGARTLGEYLWQRRQRGETIRARPDGDGYGGLYPDRAMIEDEFDAIREAQDPHDTRIAGKDWAAIRRELLHQRPLRPVKRGRCTLMPEEPRADRAHPLFQEFRVLQDVANVKVIGSNKELPLTEDQRVRLARRLMDVGSMTFGSIIKYLQLPEDSHINLGRGGREKMLGDETAAIMRKKEHFGSRWAALDPQQQRDVVERLLDHDIADNEVARWLQDETGLPAEAAAAVTQAQLPRGTGHLSIAALDLLLEPHMRAGLDYTAARLAAGLDRTFSGDGSLRKLPHYSKVLERHLAAKGRVANPTVHIALGQVQRLFNAIVSCDRKPVPVDVVEVVVELSRDLKRGFEERKRVQQAQNRNKRLNDDLRKLATDSGFPDSTENIEKLWLWKQQELGLGCVCPYTGKTLSLGDVLSSATEIDHILPRSRSFDDSRNNRVVVVAEANQQKVNRTPFEKWGGTERYEQMLDRIREMRRMPEGKRWRFTEEATEKLEGGGFLARHLNETRYLSRLVTEYLTFAVPKVRVVNGQLTALLRGQWGLNTALPGGTSERKNRDDHRHHLVDAAVIGMASQSMVHRAARENARSPDSLDTGIHIPPPWEDFRQDVKALAERCTVRHRPDHFELPSAEKRRKGKDMTSGRLHRDTAYGLILDDDGKMQRDERGNVLLVETKPLAELDPKKLDTIRDPALRDRLRALWERVEAEPTGESVGVRRQRFTELARKEHGVRRVRVLVPLGEDSLAFIRDASGRAYKAYRTDDNAYMDVWLLPDGKTAGETVSRFNAHQPGFRSRVKTEHRPARRLMRLHINDMVAVGVGDKRRILRVQSLTSSGQRIEAVDHNEGGDLRMRVRTKDREARYVPLRTSASRVLHEGLRKVSVDVLGRVRDGGPFGPDGRGKSSRS